MFSGSTLKAQIFDFIILKQDSIDLLYTSESECARGTIAQLKDEFTHRSLKKKVSANVQHVWDMMEVGIYSSTYSLQCLRLEDYETSLCFSKILYSLYVYSLPHLHTSRCWPQHFVEWQPWMMFQKICQIGKLTN